LTPSLGAWAGVNHVCDLRVVYFDDAVTHVVTPAHGPRSPSACDFEDAGFDVIGVGMLRSELRGCPHADDFPAGRHMLVRRSPPVGVRAPS